jgi:hypothetical protein
MLPECCRGQCFVNLETIVQWSILENGVCPCIFSITRRKQRRGGFRSLHYSTNSILSVLSTLKAGHKPKAENLCNLKSNIMVIASYGITAS